MLFRDEWLLNDMYVKVEKVLFNFPCKRLPKLIPAHAVNGMV
jgi:hypothetical protein